MRDSDWSIGKGYVLTRESGSAQYPYKTGEFIGPQGIVLIVIEPPSGRPKSYNRNGHTRLEYAFNGRSYNRHFGKEYTQRGLARICRKFIDDVETTNAK